MPASVDSSSGLEWIATPDPNQWLLEVAVNSLTLRIEDMPVAGSTTFRAWRHANLGCRAWVESLGPHRGAGSDEGM